MFNHVTQLSSGQTVELKEGGAKTMLTRDTVAEFRRLVVEKRLAESTRQIKALRKGFNSVVPLGMLSLFSWYEVELLVCGNPDIDVELLRKHTTYRGSYSKAHPVVKNLFTALASFSGEERRLFLRCVRCWSLCVWHAQLHLLTSVVCLFCVCAALCGDATGCLPTIRIGHSRSPSTSCMAQVA